MPELRDPVWIELSDGCRLAARVWLPDGAVDRPCPAILEAIPYRRIDGTLTIDDPRYEWWARRGFAGVRVDLRGSGDSDGVLYDEYLSQEQDDDLEVIDWIATQPWSSGRVGMIGYSWGGFAGLQVAARRPAALGAIVTVNSTVRRYTDDCHYIHGCVNAHDMLSWATTMLAFDARPPDPAVVGERWRDMWEQRLNVAPPMIEHWLSHQLEDDYWRHGSVAHMPEAITCAVLAVGGWSDPYRNAVLDLISDGTGERFGLIGPWAHGYPHITAPGPNLAFLTECERFFGRYLRGDRNGYEHEPRLRAYIQDYDRPALFCAHRGGRWVAVDGASNGGQLGLALGDGRLQVEESAADAPPAGALQVGSVQTNGLAAGNWCPYGGPSQPTDQRSDDALSRCFDTPPLREAIEILGFPRLGVRLAVDQGQGALVVRLCDVAPTGESLLVTRGIVNLAHRDGHDRVTPLVPGESVEVPLRLDCAGHRFAPGHRIRLAISPTYWPWVWPVATPVILTIESGQLTLPVLGAHAAWEPDGPEALQDVRVELIKQGPMHPYVMRDISDGRTELVTQVDHARAGRHRLPAYNLESEEWGENVYRIADDNPLSAEVICRRGSALGRPGWDVRVEVDARMTCTAEEFMVHSELRAFENGRLFVTRRFDTNVPRAS